jgi:stress response protein YsnF
MLSERELSAAIGTTAYDGSGDKIGTVEHFFIDDRTGAPTWVAVTTGLFGTRTSIAPAVDATFDDGTLRLPVAAQAVKSAPHVRGDHLDPAEEAELRQHYGVTTAGGLHAVDATQEMPPAPPPVPPSDVATSDTMVMTPTSAPSATTAPATAPASTPASTPATTPATSADGGMIRSEEQLRVGTQRVATTRARLVKYVVTEEVQITVPIRREEIRVEEVPVDAAAAGPGESLLADGESPSYSRSPGLPDEIILHTERPVVTVEVVPTERVRLRTEVVQGQETVTGQVQREQIAVDQQPAPQAGRITGPSGVSPGSPS